MPRYWLHALLAAATLLTTTVVGAGLDFSFSRDLPLEDESFRMLGTIAAHPGLLWRGLPFSLALTLILLAHEMGHYLACARYGVEATLPYFIPAPPEIGGTLGAWVHIRSAIYARRGLFDIGVAGPMAGFVFVIPALGIGLALSKIIPGIGGHGGIQLGTPLLLRAAEMAVFPGVPAADIALHPVAIAAWAGMLATALNLLPIGQTDGGYILYALGGERGRLASRLLTAALVPLGLFVWWVWLPAAALLLLLRRRRLVVVDPVPPGRARVRFAWAAAAVFALCFTAAPIRIGGGLVALR